MVAVRAAPLCPSLLRCQVDAGVDRWRLVPGCHEGAVSNASWIGHRLEQAGRQLNVPPSFLGSDRLVGVAKMASRQAAPACSRQPARAWSRQAARPERSESSPCRTTVVPSGKRCATEPLMATEGKDKK